jgi:hypothetical protein
MFYQTTVALPISRLKALVSLLDIIREQATEKNLTDANILDLRLAPDMLPFSRQIQIVSDNAKGMASRLTGKENPKMEDTETTITELQTRLTNTIAYLESFKEADFAQAAQAEARFPWFPGMHMVGADYIFGYGLPNFFFHVVTAYDILRHHGFEIGKSNYIGGELPLIADKA